MKKAKTSNYNNNNKKVAIQSKTKRSRRLCASPSNNTIQGGSTNRGAPAGLPEEDEEDQYPGQHDSGQ